MSRPYLCCGYNLIGTALACRAAVAQIPALSTPAVPRRKRVMSSNIAAVEQVRQMIRLTMLSIEVSAVATGD